MRTNLTYQLKSSLQNLSAKDSFIELAEELIMALPAGVLFDEPVWDLLSWHLRPMRKRKVNINFSITNFELQLAAKCWILDLRIKKQIVAGTARAYVSIIKYLDQVLGVRKLKTLCNADFIEAEKLINANHFSTAPYRISGYLEQFGRWLNRNFGLRISYRTTLTSNYLHGRKSDDSNRAAKIIPTPVLIDLLAARSRSDLIEKDQFYLTALTLMIPCGFRGEELMSIPKKCMPETGGVPCVLHYPEKKPQLGSKPIPVSMQTAVTKAYQYLVEKTESGRQTASKLRNAIESGELILDWPRIAENEEALRYFVKKFCHEWTALPKHHMWNNGLAWFEREKNYVDLIKLFDEHKSFVNIGKHLNINRNTATNLKKQQEAALNGELPMHASSAGRKKRTSWDTDSRVISFDRLQAHTDLFFNSNSRNIFRDIIDDARDNFQLKDKVFPLPEQNKTLESEFSLKVRPVIKMKDGTPVLQPEDTLFIVNKYELTKSRGTKRRSYHLLGLKDFSRWLCGESRSLGTRNDEDSIFSRLEIIDPRTGEIAKFTSHDVRHWLNTYYAEGGMNEEAIALLFNRDKSQNHTYDQTSSKTRLNNLRSAIREGHALGHAAETYSRIAKYSRKEAEKYLNAYTLMVNIMPHGACTLSWGMTACPNQHSCFAGSCESGEDGVCKYLSIDTADVQQIEEITRIQRETKATLDFMPDSSPQYEHLTKVEKNISTLLLEEFNG